MIKLGALQRRHYSAAQSLYMSSFPESERRPVDSLFAEDRPMHLWGIYSCDGGRELFAGIITVWHFADFIYIEHFAVEPGMRGRGIGAHVLDIICRASDKPVVVEVERPDAHLPDTQRRIAFYRRCGFNTLGYDYIQPPYQPGLPAVPLLLMVNGSEVPSPAHIAATLHTAVYGCLE